MTSRIYFFTVMAAIGITGGWGAWLMYRRGLTFLQPKWTLAFFLLMPLVFVLPNLAGSWMPRFLAKVLSWAGGYWFVFSYYSILFTLLYLFLYLASLLLQQPYLWQSLAGKFSTVVFYLLWLAIAAGSWNALHPVYRTVEVFSEKPLPREYTIAFASDLHLGTLLGGDYCREFVAKMCAVKPDLILLGGDIVDGDLAFVVEDGSYQPLMELRAPLGVYAVYGNHDYITDAPEQESALFNGSIRFLKDESVVMDGALRLTGLDDYGFGNRTPPENVPEESGYFQILMDHEPWRILAAAERGYDLYLAGHTHAGQFYPNRLLTSRLYALDYGTKSFGSMLAVVSNGYGFWGAPVRIGPAPEIVVVQIKNKR